MPRSRRLHPWLASLLGLGWLLGFTLPGAHAGAFRVAETLPRDPRAAALWQHPQVAQTLRVWTAVVTELFRLPTDVTVTPAPCGRIDGFYDPVQQQLHLCEELLTYYAGVLTPAGGDPRTPAPVVREATLFSFLHLVGHAVLAVLDLPVTAEREEAADAVGVVFLVAGSVADERTVLAGSAALAQRSRTPEPPHIVPWWTHHPWTDERVAHLRCLLAGSHPPPEAPGLDDLAAPPCREAWQRWQTLLTPSLRLSTEAPEAALPPRPTRLPRPPARCRPCRTPRPSRPWRACAPTTMHSTHGSIPTHGSSWRSSLNRRISVVSRMGASSSCGIGPGGSGWRGWRCSTPASRSASPRPSWYGPRCAT